MGSEGEACGIFLRGISRETTREQLAATFESFGAISNILIVPSRAFDTNTAYVDFEQEASAQKVGAVERRVFGARGVCTVCALDFRCVVADFDVWFGLCAQQVCHFECRAWAPGVSTTVSGLVLLLL